MKNLVSTEERSLSAVCADENKALAEETRIWTQPKLMVLTLIDTAGGTAQIEESNTGLMFS